MNPINNDYWVYNRTTDFRFSESRHAHLLAVATPEFLPDSQALLAPAVVVSPHPAAYARIADKRLLERLFGEHPAVPTSAVLASKPMEHWVEHRKRYPVVIIN